MSRPASIRRELSIERVQRWVISFLILAIAAFPTGALIAVVASIVDDGRRGDGIILLLVMAAIDIVALVAIRIVHRRSIGTPLLLLGLLPAAIATFLIL